MKLFIVHYHLRPGGVRRIIELATPQIVDGFEGAITSVTLATGEAPDRKWREMFLKSMRAVPVEFFLEPAFGYASEQQRASILLQQAIQRGLKKLLEPLDSNEALVWAHNLGLARNLLLTKELVRACDRRGLPLIAHHHDWWFDNRWLRWPELRRAGFRALNASAQAVFGSAHIRHAAINQLDAALLQKHFGPRATWLPNLTERAPQPPARRVRQARHWLRSQLGGKKAPVWILPCRMLRRKNIAEALLLKRWLRPEAWLVTAGGVSSADEQAYYDKLDAAARAHHWRLRLGVLAGDESRKPSVAELLAASEAVLLTSIQEGFGLPFLEAAGAGRALIGRNLPNVAPDLARFGFRFPQAYDEIVVHPSLFDFEGEHRRQQRLFERWKGQLPRVCRQWAGRPAMLATGKEPGPVPFSRLTLTAQLEVLAQPATYSWKRCASLNPFLIEWRHRAEAGKLELTPWPHGAEKWLSGKAYAERFREALDYTPWRTTGVRAAAIAAQEEFIRLKLAAPYLYPLLWNRET